MTDEPTSKLSTEELNFAQTVREQRDQRGWSQEDLAAKMREAGIEYANQSTVSRIEKGKRPPRLSEGQALSLIFGMTTHAMMHPDSRDMMLLLIERNETHRRRDYVQFKELARKVGDGLESARNDAQVLRDMYPGEESLPPDTQSKLTNLLRNVENFSKIDMAAEAAEIISQAQSAARVRLKDVQQFSRPSRPEDR